MVDKTNKWNVWNIFSSLLSTVLTLGLLQFAAWALGVTWYELAIVLVMFMQLLKTKGAHYTPQGEDGTAGTAGVKGKTE